MSLVSSYEKIRSEVETHSWYNSMSRQAQSPLKVYAKNRRQKRSWNANIISHLLNFKHLWLNSDSIPGNTFQGHGCSVYGKFSLYYNCGFVLIVLLQLALWLCVFLRRKERTKGGKGIRRKREKKEGGRERRNHSQIRTPNFQHVKFTHREKLLTC